MIPEHVEIIDDGTITEHMAELAEEVGKRRKKAISTVDLGAMAAAIEVSGPAAVVSHDSDFWAFRDAWKARGDPIFWVVRPC